LATDGQNRYNTVTGHEEPRPDLRRGCTAVCTVESGGCRQALFFYSFLAL